MPLEPLKDGDLGFIGLNSRDNPSSLPQGIVSKAVNIRMNRGVASVRFGAKRVKSYPEIEEVYGVGEMSNLNGETIIILALADKFRLYNTSLNTYSVIEYGSTLLSTQEGVDVVYAMGKIFVSRGFDERPFYYDFDTNTVTVFPTGAGAGHQFPNCRGLLYYCNRLIALGKSHTSSFNARNCVCVSNYLDFENWDVLDEFVFNEGGNDEVVAVSPWTLNEFLVFCRNSIYYVNIGLGRYVVGEQLNSVSFIKTLVTDIGCSAKRTIVQVNGGVMFMSDNGVYFLSPQSVGSNESVRLLSVSEPISAPIDDAVQKINSNYSHRSCAAYYGNRYYLAVPYDNSIVNNAVFVYNFILKSWESIDSYPDGWDVFNWAVGNRDNERRLFSVDTDEGILLMEELLWDEWGSAQGTPVLPFQLSDEPDVAPILTLSTLQYQPYPISAELITRRYTFNSIGEKRVSSVETEFDALSGSKIVSTAISSNPDTTTVVDNYISRKTGDVTRRNPVRKIGSGIKIKFESQSYSTSIRSNYIYATQQKYNNRNQD